MMRVLQFREPLLNQRSFPASSSFKKVRSSSVMILPFFGVRSMEELGDGAGMHSHWQAGTEQSNY